MMVVTMIQHDESIGKRQERCEQTDAIFSHLYSCVERMYQCIVPLISDSCEF